MFSGVFIYIRNDSILGVYSKIIWAVGPEMGLAGGSYGAVIKTSLVESIVAKTEKWT